MTSPFVPYPEERRLATVMFADIQSFTEMAERLDFEEVTDLIKEVWLTVDTAIEAHGGYIDKHIGDAVMAVWGAPYAREDDAERAVTAALAMQSAIADYARMSPRRDAHRLKMRVALNTGWVLAGHVGLRGEYTMMGNTVNVASRLEQHAEPGTIIISESTYRLVRGAFRVRRLPPLRVRGKSDLVQAFIVEGALNQPSRMRYRGAGGLETRMVAREAKLARLIEMYQAAQTAAAPTMAIIRAEAGLGKSRLLLEFTSQLEVDEPVLNLFTAKGLEQTSRIPFFIWKLLWQTYFGLSEDDSPEVQREKFLRGVHSLWGRHSGVAVTPASALANATEATHRIGNLIGLEWPDSPYLKDSPETQVERAFALTRELLRRVTVTGPTVLVVDDLHWADEGSVDLLTHLLEPAETPLPMLILSAARPGFLRWQPLLNEKAEIITLHSLPILADVVAAAYPSLRYLPEATLMELARQSEGNPYFLEEMVKSQVYTKADWGRARPRPTGMLTQSYLSTTDSSSLKDTMPASLHSMLQARLDALSPEARQVALLASVVGRVFWVGAILAAARYSSAMGAGMFNPESVRVENVIQEGLAELVKAELAFPRVGSLFAGEQEYIFKNSLLRDVAYGLLPVKHRRQYHLAVARWLMTYAGPEFAANIADHLEQSGSLVEAAQQYAQAARHALLRGADSEAAWLREHALELEGQASRGEVYQPLL
jgi:class 3 adenylate cyclase/predicted ATPase